MTDFTDLFDLASERLGGVVLYANDEFFAPRENLLKPGKPVFLEHEYTDRGKWMDGWETRRRRVPGFDFCLVRLGAAGTVRGVVLDTAFFRGNYPDHASIDACAARADASPESLLDPATRWVEVLPKSPVGKIQRRALREMLTPSTVERPKAERPALSMSRATEM